MSILSVYDSEMWSVRHKADGSPLTDADLRAHEILREGLSRLTPEIPLLSEEDPVPFALRRQWHRFWLIDPLDGTREFLHRSGEFAICVALVEDHRPRMGLIDLPVDGTTFVGIVEHGAWRYDRQGQEAALHLNRPPGGIPQSVAISRSGGPREQTWLTTHEWGRSRLVPWGSAWKFAMVAEGSVQGYLRLEPCMEWDVCAGHGLLLAAGGTVQALDGTPIRYNLQDDLHFPPFWAGHPLEDGVQSKP